MTRRAFAAGAITAAMMPSKPVVAEMPLGDSVLRTVSDGHLTLPGDMVFAPMPQTELAPLLKSQGIARETLTPECNLALYQDGARNVLFDVGSGPDFMPTAGSVLDSLDALGLTADDITHVIFTHAHPDHIWGVLDDFEDPTFPGAQYMMGRTEWDYWWNPETVRTIGEARAAFAVGARRRMEAIADAITLFDDGAEVLPGVMALASHGHTPGHMSFELRQGNAAALVVGDAIGNHHVACLRPEWQSGSDQIPELAVAARMRLLERAAAEGLTLAGFHFPNGGMGRIERFDTGYRFVQEDL